MGKTGLTVVLGLLWAGPWSCGLALATANDPIAAAQSAQSAREQAAAADYLRRWTKAYDNLPADEILPDQQPPFDLFALVHGTTVLKQAMATCRSQASNLKSISAVLNCGNSAIKSLVEYEKLHDKRLFGSFQATVVQLGADADTGKIGRNDAVLVYGTLANVFDRAVFVEFENYIDHAGPMPTGTEPPYDRGTLVAAIAAAKESRSGCDVSTADKDGTATLACLADSDSKFSASVKMRDKPLVDFTVPLLRRAAADTDAGMMTHTELLAFHDYLWGAALAVMDTRYDAYLARQYSDQFEKLYSQAQSAHGKYVADKPARDEAAAAAAQSAFDVADAACSVPDAFATSAALLTCKVNASRAYITASKMRDTDLFEAYADTVRSIGADADEKKMTNGQRDSVLAIVGASYAAKLQQEDKDFRSREDKPLIDAYLAKFDRAYTDAKAAHGPDNTNSPPYDFSAVKAAAAANATVESQCAAKRADFKTMRDSEECFLDAYRIYFLAIKAKDTALLESMMATERSVATDADTGKITGQQASAILSAISTHENDLIDEQGNDYEAARNAPLIAAHLARFRKSYADAITAHGTIDAGSPPYDLTALKAADVVLAAGVSQCRARHAQLTSNRATEECFLDTYRTYFAAIKAVDRNFLDSYIATQQAIAADADAGKITDKKAEVVFNAVAADENDKLNKEWKDYALNITKLLVANRVTRFQTLYRDALRANGAPPSDLPPYDFAADSAAVAERNKTEAACRARAAELKTQAALLECQIDANRIYLVAIKIRDMALFYSWATALREAAADTDSGKLSTDQWRAVYSGLQQSYNDIRGVARQRYQMREPLIVEHVRAFDNDYFAARKAAGSLPAGAAFDDAAAANARDEYGRATRSCNLRREELNTAVAWAACMSEASRNFVTMIKLRDTVLFEQNSIALRRAATEADAGKITRDQLATIAFGLSVAVTAIFNQEIQDGMARPPAR